MTKCDKCPFEEECKCAKRDVLQWMQELKPNVNCILANFCPFQNIIHNEINEEAQNYVQYARRKQHWEKRLREGELTK